MLLQLSLLHFIFLLLPLAFSSSLIAKPSCPDRCGNLSIPFPFGVGQDCSLEESFKITCTTSTNSPAAYISTRGYGGRLEVTEINPSQVRIKMPYLQNAACYNTSGNLGHGSGDAWYGIDLTDTQYTVSDENWLTGIGCDDLVVGIGLGNVTFGGGCVSYCKNETDPGGEGFCPDNDKGYSAGVGCCRTPIPRGIAYLGAQLSNLNGKWRDHKLFPCSYAFFQEKDQSEFRYPLSYLNDTGPVNYTWGPTSTLPVVRLEWRVGSKTCSEAQRNSATYACKGNSTCDDVDFGADANIRGYRCRCSEGYDGNPYLNGGCQDTDECADSRINPCNSNSTCINTLGSVYCQCPEGYYGDGRTNGMGCIRLPQYKTTNHVIFIGLGSGLGFIVLLSMCFWLHKILQKRKNKMRKEKFFKRNGGLILQQQTNEGTLEKTKLFPEKELEKATDHFNESRILGQGGQGTVYKGMLSDGKIVAIKKSKQVDENQLEQFINEVVILSQINHRNVVKLLGCCLETDVPLLVYEFVPNGTLFDLIHDPSTEFSISWDMRLKIAADVAGALAYLHFASSTPIYHRDIKSSNILLDEKYIVKVSDFGTSKSFVVDQTHLTTMVKGTIGYLDPEYFQSNQFTEKSDVYSFGVVLVELLTRQRPISMERTKEERSLVTWFLTSMESNNLDAILDPQVLEQGRKEEVIAVARLAQRCLNLMGKMRPTMKEVAIELESLRISQMPSIVKDEYEEARVHEGAAAILNISDIDYTWTTSGNSVASSSSDKRPLIFASM